MAKKKMTDEEREHLIEDYVSTLDPDPVRLLDTIRRLMMDYLSDRELKDKRDSACE